MESKAHFVKLKMTEYKDYTIIDYNDDSLYMLGAFLARAIMGDLSYNFFTDWLKGKYEQDEAFGNAYGLRERDGKVYPGFIWDPEEEHFKYFGTTKEYMLQLIDDWVQVIIQKPNTILMTKKNGTIEFTIED